MIVLGIDPGIHTGWAIVRVDASGLALLDADLASDMPLSHPDYVIIEKPVIYPHAKENPNDLLTLSIQVGRYAERFKHCHSVALVAARTWKGQVPKSVTEQRVCDRFPNAAVILARFPKSLRHNVSDAIGLALWEAQRVRILR